MNNQDQNLKTDEIFCIDEMMDELYIYVKNELEKRGRQHVNVEILKYTDLDKCLVRTNRQRLWQIFTNLLDNVAKVTDRGYIFFGYHTGIEGTVRFFIEDTGMGIYIDSDLELSIAQGLVQQMGGKITVEPEKEAGMAIRFNINCKLVEE